MLKFLTSNPSHPVFKFQRSHEPLPAFCGFYARWQMVLLVCSMMWVAIEGTACSQPTATPDKETSNESKKILDPSNSKKEEASWKPLLSGSDLSEWEVTNFGGEGDVALKDGVLTLGFGDPLTGINTKRKDFPTDNYEMRWEAMRTQGQDFFACATFPIGDEFCSFIAGGWGGSLTGISSIDGNDASENETTGSEDFKNNVWYQFRVRVDPEKLSVWINDSEVISVNREDHQFSLRIEVESSKPLGYCNFQCEAKVRRWEYRLLDDAKSEKKASSNGSVSMQKSDDSPVFLRIKKESGDVPIALQTTVSSYKIGSGPYAGATIDLIGAVHVAERQYYRELNRRFKTYDALLYELVADPDVRLSNMKKDRGVYNPLSAMQVGMRDVLDLTFQLDEVDYKAKNFVHADMTPDEFAADMARRKDGFLAMAARVIGSSIAAQGSPEMAGADAKMIAAMMSSNRSIALRRVMAEQFESMDIQLSGLADSKGQSTLLTERNRKAMEVLLAELKKGKRKLGIFYGAAHLKDMDRRLINDFAATRGEVAWIDAWNLQ